MYKVAISDLDGTLLGPDHKVSAETKSSIHKWIQSGRKFVIATGRHHIEAQNLQDELGEPIYLITSNGARVHNKQGETILKQNLSTDIATEICNMDFPEGVQVNLFTDHHWYTSQHLPEHDEAAIGEGLKCRQTDLKNLDKSNTIKIFFCAKPELLQPIYAALKARFADSINLTFSLDVCLEVMHANTNKGTAVAAVLKEKGITVEQAIAFGDGMNDLEMLSLVSKPVLMANAQATLLEALPDAEITLSAKEHGVSVKLDSLLG